MHRTNRLKLTYLLHTATGLSWWAAWRRAGLWCATRRHYARKGANL
jgi:hypothetical protein